MEAWKLEIGKKAMEAGLIKDPQWLSRLDEPTPMWVVLELMLRLLEAVDPPSDSYD